MNVSKAIFNESINFFLSINEQIRRIGTDAEAYDMQIIDTILDMIQEFLSILRKSMVDYYGYNVFEENQRAILHTLKNIRESKVQGEYQEKFNVLYNEMNKGYIALTELLEKNRLEVINLGRIKLREDAVIDENVTVNDIYKYLDDSSMNDLERFFFRKSHFIMTKWLHYFEIYHRHFQKYRNKSVTIMEIGVFGGGSMQMWKDYFGPQARIIGIDIDPKCKEYEDNQIEIYIGSQEDREFLRQLRKQIASVDILIDDGGHTMNQQMVTFEELYDWISEDGVYLCEDLHTSYWERYGGGFRREGSFIEYSKTLIDKINAWHSETRELGSDAFTKSTHSLHYYDSILVIEKRKTYKPMSVALEVI